MYCIRKNYFLLLLIGFLSACKPQSSDEVLVCDIYPVDFTDIIEMDGTVQAVNSVTLTCPRRVEGEIIYLVEDGSYVSKGDTVCIIENMEMKRDYEETLLRVENSKANLTKSESNLAMQYANLQAQVQSNETEMLIKKLDSLQLNYVSENDRKITELELKKAQIEREKLLKRLDALETINKAEIKKLKLRIKQDENRAARNKEQLDQMTLVATQEGLAVRANSWLTGKPVQESDQIWGPMPVLEIPDLSIMKVKFFASEINYKRISTENKVEMTFDAMPGNKAYGKITMKAPVGQPISRNSKVKFFEIEASIDSFDVIPEPGLSAQCKIFLQEIKDTIVVPQIAIFDEDSISAVYVKAGKSFVRREVTIAEKSQKYAVISEGLTGDECLSLIKPNNVNAIKTIFIEKQTDTIETDSIPQNENTNAE